MLSHNIGKNLNIKEKPMLQFVECYVFSQFNYEVYIADINTK